MLEWGCGKFLEAFSMLFSGSGMKVFPSPWDSAGICFCNSTPLRCCPTGLSPATSLHFPYSLKKNMVSYPYQESWLQKGPVFALYLLHPPYTSNSMCTPDFLKSVLLTYLHCSPRLQTHLSKVAFVHISFYPLGVDFRARVVPCVQAVILRTYPFNCWSGLQEMLSVPRLPHSW